MSSSAVKMRNKTSNVAGKGPSSGKKEKSSVLAMLVGMESKPSKPKKASKPETGHNSYTAEMDLPPSDDEDEGDDGVKNIVVKRSVQQRAGAKVLDTSLTGKELKKRAKKDFLAAQAAEQARQESLRDDCDAFTVTIRAPTSVLDGGDEAGANVKDIVIENFSVSVRGRELLNNVTLKISHGKKYGLIGRNGTGKSTLLKLLAWRMIPVPKNIDVLLVEQEVVGDDRTALEAVVSANEELVKLRAEVAALQTANEDENAEEYDDSGGARLADLFEKLQLMGSDAAEAQASKILAGLGFTKDMQVRPTKSFSGGWRMRISLARALFIQPTLLLLDEPTNHLDLRAVLWLEEYLSRWKKTVIVVSHDRDFVEAVCNGMTIRLADKNLYVYRDGDKGFENHKLIKEAEELEKKLKTAKRSGRQDQQKTVQNQQERNKLAQNKGKGKGDEDDPRPVPVQRERKVEFHFPEPTQLTPPLLQLIEVSFSYPNRPDFRLSNVDVGIDMGTRVAIVGPNGAGKSTVLNLLAGDLSPSEGEARRGQKLRIGRYSQHFVDVLTMSETPVDYLLRLHKDYSKVEDVRAKLGKFGLPKENHTVAIAKLSGGQKARVVFTSIAMSNPHILLLDEPTNHLDADSIDALATALDEFTGEVVLVSHDSRLISQVCGDEQTSQIWVCDQGTVSTFPGSFQEYKEELQEEIKAEVDS